MKKILMVLGIIVLLFCGVAHAQVVIDSRSLPLPGDTFALKQDFNPQILLGSSSSQRQHWDFSTLASDSTRLVTYDVANHLPYDGSSNVCLKLLKTPFSVDSSGSQKTYLNTNLNRPRTPGNVDTLLTSFLTSEMRCDAWGTISTPIENFVDVVRIHEQRMVVDSIYATNNGVLVSKNESKKVIVNNYFYYSPLKRYPIAVVYCRSDNSISIAEYLDHSDLHNDLGVIEMNQLPMFPNPVIDVLKLDRYCENAIATILTTNGKLVKSVTLSVSGYVDVKGLPSGLYLIIVRCNSMNYNGRFVKE